MKDEGRRMKAEERRKPVDLKLRTKQFALRTIRLYSAMPKSAVAQVLGKQMLRSATSVGAHYREATRSRSNAEFISKIQGGLQELEETSYWLELTVESGIFALGRVENLLEEANELTAIFTTCVKNARRRKK